MPRHAGWSRTQYFTQVWQNELKPVPQLFVGATVEIVKYDTSSLEYDPITNEYTGGERTVVWSGVARVQPRQAVRPTANSAADTILKTVQFQFGELDLDVTPDMRFGITECSLNPVLCNYMYVADGVMDSSNPIERTITCKVDTEVRT